MSKPVSPKKSSSKYQFKEYALKPIPDLDAMTLEEAMELNDYVKWADFKNKLNAVLVEEGHAPVQTHNLYKVKNELDHTPRDSASPPPIKKAGGIWLIRPSDVSDKFRSLLSKTHVTQIPESIRTANQLIELDGIFSWTQISQNYPPFTIYQTFVPNYVENNHKNPSKTRKTCGIWKDSHHRGWLVDMKKFVPWFFDNIWIPEETTDG